MDGRRFDAWVKGLPHGSPREFLWQTSRRGVLKALAGIALALALRPLRGKDADAAGEGICDNGCGSLCEPTPAQLACNFKNPNCSCLRSTSGAVHCADASTRSCPVPGAADECQQDGDCAPNEICVRTAGGICCAEAATEAQVNFCIPRCLNLTTAGAARAGRGKSILAGVRKRL
jgi:hypothetical protein